MAHFTTVATLDFAVVSRQRAIFGEMTDLLAVAARNGVWVPRLITFFGYVVLRAAVAASPRWTSLDVGTLLCVSQVTGFIVANILGLGQACGCTYILGKVTSLVALAALDALS